MPNQDVLWAGRFLKPPTERTIAYTASFSVDKRLAWYDVIGSIAHAKMLAKQGILRPDDAKEIVAGLKALLKEIEAGHAKFDEKLEDIHTNVEFLLTARIGEAGGRLHTARSRNDQVVTDFRLYVRDSTLEVIELIEKLQIELMAQARAHTRTIMPGFTHMQHAQPVSLGHHLLAHVAKLQRDANRMLDSYKRVNLCPLGSAALAGTTYPIDREYAARLLAFDGPTLNSMDSVSDRDFAAEFLFCASLAMVHLSQFAEELVIWSTPEFGFVELSEAHSTGSSIMPQKKNPDVAEMIRGRAAKTIGNLTSMLAILKGLPLTYDSDLSGDKELVFSTADVLVPSLRIETDMLAAAKFDEKRMLEAARLGYLNATELADYLTTKGLPFRQAHEATGKAVREAISKGKRLEELSLEELREFSSLVGPDVYEAMSLESGLARRTSFGGTAPPAVKEQLSRLRVEQNKVQRSVHVEKARISNAYEKLISQ
ncbi:MAG TPA: argininosuccinate lyase [Methanomassiliicoccales archaeon]|nr:argininosuccinate lyase [Methanomassiliicoccales archaeon]